MGVDKQPCGPIAFQVEVDDDNAPRNILEEIVWSKTSEIEKWRLVVNPGMMRARAMQVILDPSSRSPSISTRAPKHNSTACEPVSPASPLPA